MSRTREEIKVLFERVGITYKVGKFNAIYNRAKELQGGSSVSDDKVNVRAFLQAVKDLHTIE
jgi:hypothetical protein